MKSAKQNPFIVSSKAEAAAHFRAAGVRHLKFLSGEEIESWAERTTQAYIDRGAIVVRTPLPAIDYRTLLAMASEELVDAIVEDARGAKEAFRAILHEMALPAPARNAQTLSEQAFDRVERHLKPFAHNYYDEACRRLKETFTYCEARAHLEGTRTFG